MPCCSTFLGLAGTISTTIWLLLARLEGGELGLQPIDGLAGQGAGQISDSG